MAPQEWVVEAVVQINARLKAANLPVRVLLRGKAALTLQATLPRKPGQEPGKKQQEISLAIQASKEGLRRIENEAHILSRHLVNGTFSWNLYLAPIPMVQPKTTSEVISEFKQQYLSSNQIKETTWRESWQRTFDRLPQDEPLSEVSILAVVLLTNAHTRIRELTCQRLQRLAEFAGIAVDLKPLQGKYSDASLTPRDIPDNALILEWRDRIPNPEWQWVFGIMATFGLRPHEVFFCEFGTSKALQILEGKTDYHIARPILPEWVESWDLKTINCPKVKGRTYRDYGQRVYRQFQRYKIPFNPYDLRHAYAIRGSIVKGLPVQVMAEMMGHSPQVHLRTYNRWLKDAVAEQVYNQIFSQADRESK